MWLVSQIIPALVGVLFFALPATPSFGSNIPQHNDEIQQYPPTKHPFIMVSSEERVPQDVRVYILSFLEEQKDLLHIGTVSKSWRQAAAKIWENRELDLSNKHLTGADYKSLARGIFPRLKLNEVRLEEKGMDILATGSHLQALELRGNNLRATESLIKLLSLSYLSHIDLWNNPICAEGAKAIADLLSQNAALTRVDLDFNRIGDEGAKAIARALFQNKTLTKVNLTDNSIGDEGAKAIADLLSQNTTLTRVDLDFNRIGDEGAKAIAEALTQNTTLTTVSLDSNRIGTEGVKAIARALFQNMTLTTVDLYGNSIGDEGAKAIAEALKENKTLTVAGLASNSIGDEGAKAIAEALKENKTLTRVDLVNNKIGNAGKKALEGLKRSRPSLKVEY